MPLIHKNLTPFFWGPKVTARRPRELEMAICVRGVFRLQPGQPLTPIEDPIEQGFMSGDTWSPEDLERTGPILRSSDFADWKPKVDLLLTGSAYPPGGKDVTCDVGWGVGTWSKNLRVYGPRVYRPAILRRGSLTDPLPFSRMPLTWENAYGGPGYGRNPTGKGYTVPEMPNVEYPNQPVTVPAQRRVQPATFLPLSPNWPERWQKVGRNYGKKWEETRAPFVSDDFDWTFYNAAPQDQQLDQDLRGDEPMVFLNLHPQAPRWESRLPGLRVRALVRGGDDRIHDVILRLDTVHADLDAGRLYLTWRAHVPVTEQDLSDVKSALIVSEPLADPLHDSDTEYLPILLAFEDDPIGIKDKFPPGFFEVADAIEAFEQAEIKGDPPPDLRKVAESLPAGCPFPPWFLLAVAGDADPLGIMDSMPSFAGDDPLGLKGRIGALATADPAKLLAGVKAAGSDPAKLADALAELADSLPTNMAGPVRDAAENMKQAAASSDKALSEIEDPPPELTEALAKVKAPPPTDPPPIPTAEAQLAGMPAILQAAIDNAAAAGPEAKAATAGLPAALAQVPSFNDMVAKSLAPIDDIKLPPLPVLPDMNAFIADMQARMDDQKAKLEAQGVDHPLMGLFDKFQRVIDKSPRPEDIPIPDMTTLIGGLMLTKETLVAQGASLAAVAPLTRLAAKVEAHMAALPQPKPGPEAKDYAYQELGSREFDGQDLRGKSFARSVLKKATFRGADLRKADFTEADLTGADLTGAQLEDAVLRKAVLAGATLGQAQLARADLRDADLTEAKLPQVQAAQVNLEGAILDQADLSGSNLAKACLNDASLQDADLTGCDLPGASLESVRAIHATLAGANLEGSSLRFADLTRADLRQANLRDVDLSIATVSKVRGDGVDLSGARLDMTQIQKARLRGATLVGARSDMGSLAGSDLTGADLREVDLHKVDFAKCILHEANFERARLRICLFRDVQARKVRFVRAELTQTSATGDAVFEDCEFGACKARRIVFYEVTLRDCDFSHADLTDAHFQGITGDDLNFFAATLKGAEFRKARLTRTRFAKAHMNRVNLSESRLLDTQFTGANCYDAKFFEAEIASCDWLEANLLMTRWDRSQGGPR